MKVKITRLSLEMLRQKIRNQQDRDSKDKERKADTGDAPSCERATH